MTGIGRIEGHKRRAAVGQELPANVAAQIAR